MAACGFVILSYLGSAAFLVDFLGETNCEVLFRQRDERPFDAALWADVRGQSMRYQIANYIVRSGSLQNQTANRVEHTLGIPTVRELEDNFIFLDYFLIDQYEMPSKTFLIPFGLSNCDCWYLRCAFSNDSLVRAEIVVK